MKHYLINETKVCKGLLSVSRETGITYARLRYMFVTKGEKEGAFENWNIKEIEYVK